jgi:hypothetical protein
MVIDTEKDLAMRETGGLGRPLRVPLFRNLLIADLVSDIGTFMQNVGAAWLMVSLHAWSGLCRSYPNCGFSSLLSIRTTCGFRWRYLRSPQTHSIYRSLDDGGGVDSGRSDHERRDFPLAAARADICTVRWRRV